MGTDFAKLEKLMELMRKHGMNEVRLSDESGRIVVVANPPQAVMQHGGYPPPQAMYAQAPMAMGAPSHAPSADSAAEKPKTAAPKGKEKVIKSPFVGTFYRSSAPGSDPFVSPGQRVKKGDVLCIVEAMKLMNEIEAEMDGVIREILVENESPVEFDQSLFIME